MFNAAEETDANWDTDLRDDVAMEVRDKYGEVDGIYVVKDSEVTSRLCISLQPCSDVLQGEIYIKFTDQESAQKALGGLNGRFL